MPSTEQKLHDDFYNVQGALSAVATAMREARENMYRILHYTPDTDEFETLRYEANRWLDKHGRDIFKEERAAL